MDEVTVPPEAYEAVARDRVRRWGYHHTVASSPSGEAALVSYYVADSNLRADVDAVWPLAVAAGREQAAREVVDAQDAALAAGLDDVSVAYYTAWDIVHPEEGDDGG